MTPGRWREIERLFHAALEQQGDARDAFLTDACAGDQALRREVESLLDQRERSAGFLRDPALERHVSLMPHILRSMRTLETPAGALVGRTLGVYRLDALIGAGGMGEVYRAVDTRLNRTVAVKVLPEHTAIQAEQRQRFEREARIVSSLNHPHICALYDVGTDGSVNYLVMEHVEGETLQQRLQQGPLPIDRALECAVQICDALDKAHRRGVVHRDLKPANVMLTKSGAKLLDFGAAMWGATAEGTAAEAPEDERVRGLTAQGMILGTLQYLSPEQLEGRQADARSDIFAFGCLVYETIAGRPAFNGASQAAIIGAILKDEPPPIDRAAADAPPALARTIARCLAKDPDDRFQTANDLLFQLRSMESSSADSPPRGTAGALRHVWIERALWLALLAAAVIGTALWSRAARPPQGFAADAAPIRFSLFAAPGTVLHSAYNVPFAVAPDGRSIAYLAHVAGGVKHLWLHALHSDEKRPLPGTEGAESPFWSPDSEWIGFFADNSLKKIRVSTGVAQLVATDVRPWGGATWNSRDVIVFSAGPQGLLRVSARGGTASPLATGEGSLFWPQFLSDGLHCVYASSIPAAIRVRSLDGGATRTLMTFAVRISALVYVPGYLFFVQDAKLFVRPFDENRREFSGEPVAILDGIPMTAPGRAPFSVSPAGVLAYWSAALGAHAELRWFSRSGTASAPVAPPASLLGFTLSPDGREVVFSRIAPGGSADLWNRTLASSSERQLTFDGASFAPQWSPDGTRIAFSGPGQSPPPKLFVKPVAGTAAPTLVGDARRDPSFASTWTADSRAIVSVRIDPSTRNDLWLEPLQNGAPQRLWFNTASNEAEGKISPDGRWIAYVTDQSGRDEVWAASFPSGGVRRQISAGGGASPQWVVHGRELVYLAPDQSLMAAPVVAGASGIESATPRVLFRIPGLADVDRPAFPTANAYVASSDGQRFLVAVRPDDATPPPISVVANWRALLRGFR